VPASFPLAWEPELVPEPEPVLRWQRNHRLLEPELHIRSNPCHDDGTTSRSNRCKPALHRRKPVAAADMASVLGHKRKPEPVRMRNHLCGPNNLAFPHSP